MKCLFLDIDGVLNVHDFCPNAMCGPIHRDKVALLNRVLDATNARIVLSSAWRYLVHRGEMNLTGLGWLLRSHGLHADRLVGVTREDTVSIGKPFGIANYVTPDERGDQIAEWLRRSPDAPVGITVTRHAVVDDLDLGITAAGHPFVQTDGKVGLTEADAGRLIELLGAA